MNTAVISAWSVTSPFGLGTRRFTAGLVSGRTGLADLEPEQSTAPAAVAAPVPDFDVQEVLGRKGTRSMDRLSAFAVATTGDLLSQRTPGHALAAGTEVALVLGTTIGSAKSMMDITRDTFTQAKPFFIDTGRIPNAIMNSAAAQCAIWHGLRGPNATIAGGHVAVLLALQYASRLLAARRAKAVLCGGAEELTPERMWLEHHARGADPALPLGEGCALFLLEPAEHTTPTLATVLAIEVGVYDERTKAEAYTGCLSRALARAGISPEELSTFSPSGLPEWREIEQRALGTVFGNRCPRVLTRHAAWGDAGAATAAFQIAELLAIPDQPSQPAAVMAVDRDGVLGCIVLRIE
jgi:3-oxoacyl-[acyl-carrier-protein] synthase II